VIQIFVARFWLVIFDQAIINYKKENGIDQALPFKIRQKIFKLYVYLDKLFYANPASFYFNTFNINYVQFGSIPLHSETAG
jgi:hypothetical protein